MDVYQRRRLVALSAIAAVFVVIVLLIRSCGGDEEEPVEPTPVAGVTGLTGATSLAQEDYIAEGDAICLQANTAIAAIDSSDPLNAAAEEASAVEGEIQGFNSLTIAEGEEPPDKFLNALEDHYDLLQDHLTAIENEDTAAQAELEPLIDEAESKEARLAERYGFENCGDPSAVGESTSTGGEGGGTEAETPTETETGGETPPPVETTPVVPTDPVVPPTDTGTEGGVGTEPPPTDTGGTDSSSGGVSP